MTTGLTLYGINTAATTLVNADKCGIATGGTEITTITVKIGTVTGYGELYARGNTGAWSGAGSIGTPSGRGFLWDVTTLEGQQIVSGNWTPTFTLKTSTGTITADIFVRAYIYDSVATTYTLIGTMSKTGQSITTTKTAYALVAGSLSAVTFTTGQELYYDVWLNITVGDGNGSATITLYQATSGTLGVASDAQLVTPGYAPINTLSLSSRLRLQSPLTYLSLSNRLRLLAQTSFNQVARLRIKSQPTSIALFTRLVLALFIAQSQITRLRLQSSPQSLPLPLRLRFRALNYPLALRFLLSTGTSTVNYAARAFGGTVAYSTTVLQPLLARLQVSVQTLLSLTYRLHVAALTIDTLSFRARIGALATSSLLTRLRVSVQTFLSFPVRLSIHALSQQGVTLSTRLLALHLSSLANRLILWGVQQRDIPLRVQTNALLQRHIGARFPLASLAQTLSLLTRLPLQSLQSFSAMSRVRIIGEVFLAVGIRLRLLVQQSLSFSTSLRLLALSRSSIASRFSLQSIAQWKDSGIRFLLWSLHSFDSAIRFPLRAVTSLDTTYRIVLQAQSQIDQILSLRTRVQALFLPSLHTRFSLRTFVSSSLVQRIDVAAGTNGSQVLRLLVSSLAVRTIVSRINVRAQSLLSFGTRLKASAQTLSSLSARLVMNVPFQQTVQLVSRVLLQGVIKKEVSLRLQANAVTTFVLPLRLRLSALPFLSLPLRFFLHAQAVRALQARLPLWSLLQQGMVTRLSLSSISSSSLAHRVRLRAGQTFYLANRIRLLAQQIRTLSTLLLLVQALISTMSLGSRLRLLALSPSSPLALRYRLSMMVQSVVMHRVQIAARSLWNLPTRLVMQGLRRSDILLRLICVTGYHTQDCLVRVFIAVSGTPPTGFKMRPPIRTKVLNPLHTSGMTTAGPVYETGIYLVNGVMLETQPLIRTAPRVQGRMVPKDSQFTLIFADPTRSTQSLLQDGASMDMTILLQQGESLTVPVQITTTSTTSSLLIVLCTLQQMVTLPS